MTRWLALLGVLALPLLLWPKTRPIAVLLFGIVAYHGVAVSVSNIIDLRYVSAIYPELAMLAALGCWYIFLLYQGERGVLEEKIDVARPASAEQVRAS
jgi:hypothetical protein